MWAQRAPLLQLKAAALRRAALFLVFVISPVFISARCVVTVMRNTAMVTA